MNTDFQSLRRAAEGLLGRWWWWPTPPPDAHLAGDNPGADPPVESRAGRWPDAQSVLARRLPIVPPGVEPPAKPPSS